MCYSVDILETELLQKYGIYCRCLYDFFSFLLVGVVQLLNKLDATSFNKNDENLFEVNRNFCPAKLLLLHVHGFNSSVIVSFLMINCVL